MRFDAEKKYENWKNWKIKISEHSFTLKTSDCGVFFPIIRTIKSGIFGLLTVNYEEGSMPIKYNALFMNKQHPTLQVLVSWERGLKNGSGHPCIYCISTISGVKDETSLFLYQF